MMKINKNTIYLITDRHILEKRSIEYLKGIEEAILGGVDIVQFREKNLSTKELIKLAKDLKRLTDSYNIPLIINDRVDIAAVVDCAGVHLGQNDMPINYAREILGKEKIIGLSTANLEEAKEAELLGADYIGFGAVYNTKTKKDTRSVTVKDLERVKKEINIPIVAIGGIKKTNIVEVKRAGADGSALVSAILDNELSDIKEAVEYLKKV